MAFDLKNFKLWTTFKKYNNGSKSTGDLHFIKADVVDGKGSAKFTDNGTEYTAYYRKYTDGHCIQYGNCKVTKNNKAKITLPKSFKNSNFVVFASVIGSTSTNLIPINAIVNNANSFYVFSSLTDTISKVSFSWLAIGTI